MSNLGPPRLSKWPFLVGDLFLVGAGALVMFRGPTPVGPWQALVCLAAISTGAWLGALPFLREYQGAIRLSEAEGLAATVTQIDNLQRIQAQIAAATAQWEGVQQHSTQTVTAAKEITDRIQTELAQLCAFLQKAQDSEKNHLRLEIEKLRRNEHEWLQAAVLILDHVFALHTAASHTGQPALIAQLGHFQSACREAVRRVGLSGFAPNLADPFDPQLHQLETGPAKSDDPLQVKQILALGYTYQGEVVRRALVKAEPTTSG